MSLRAPHSPCGPQKAHSFKHQPKLHRIRKKVLFKNRKPVKSLKTKRNNAWTRWVFVCTEGPSVSITVLPWVWPSSASLRYCLCSGTLASQRSQEPGVLPWASSGGGRGEVHCRPPSVFLQTTSSLLKEPQPACGLPPLKPQTHYVRLASPSSMKGLSFPSVSWGDKPTLPKESCVD